MTILIAGSTGFVGTHLRHRLKGRALRLGTRDPERARSLHPQASWVLLDVERPSTLPAAMEGVDAVVYLVHQMRGEGPYGARELQAAADIADAAADAGVRRIVYLGGPRPLGPPSPHLKSRLATGERLRAGRVSTIELRASMIVGPGSESWLIVRDLAMRLPVMVLPSWLSSRSQPQHISDAVEAIAAAIDLEHPGSAAYDLPGPETLTARQIIERVAAARGFRHLMVPVPVLTPKLSSHWIRMVTRADFDIAKELVDGLKHDLVSPDDGFWRFVPNYRRTPFDEAVRLTLDAEGEVGGWQGRWERVVRKLAPSR